MSGVQLLVRTPFPYRSESLFGYALRVSEQNGYSTPWHVLIHAGLSHGELKTAGFPVEKFAKVLGKLPVELEPIAYCERVADGGKKYKILGHSLGAEMTAAPLRLNQPAFCPQCVKADGYIDAFWDLKIAVACPVHRVRVLRICPSCGDGLNMFRPGLLQCKCGSSLGNHSLPDESEALCELMGVMFAILHRAPIDSGAFVCGLPVAKLQNVPFGSLMKGLSSLGAYALRVENRAEDQKNPLELMRRASEILKAWPANFHEFLNQLGARPDFQKSNAVGLRAQFADFYSAMFIGRGWCKDLEFLREEFVNFGLSVWGRAIVDKKMLRRSSDTPPPTARFMTLSNLAQAKGVKFVTLQRWEARGLLSLKKTHIGSGKRYVVDAIDLNVSAHHPGEVYGQRQAAAYLRFPVSVLRALRISGHYRVQHIPEHKPQYHQKDLDAFLHRLFERLPLDVAGDNLTGPFPSLSLGQIFLQGKVLAVAGKAAFVGAYLDGKVDAIGRSGSSAHDILFARVDVDLHFKTARLAAAKGCLTAAQTATLIDCDPVAIRSLVADGYLVERRRLNRFAVCEKSAKRFSTRFVALSSLANQLQTTSTALLRLCDEEGIRMIRVARSADATIAFARRSDSEAISDRLAEKRIKPTRAASCIARVQQYLLHLSGSGDEIPFIGSRINKSEVAKACKVDRKTLADNKIALQMIEAYQIKMKASGAVGGPGVCLSKDLL